MGHRGCRRRHRLGGPGRFHEHRQPAHELGDAEAGHGRDAEVTELRDADGVSLPTMIGLAPDHQAGTVEQVGLVAAELVEQHAVLLFGPVAGQGSELQQDDEHPGAGDVAEESVAETLALGGALDEARGCRPP